MTEYTYFGNRGSITVGGETIAVLKGIEVKVTFEHEELYGMDSILRQGVAKHTAAVEVKISAAKFDPAMGAGLGEVYGWVLKGVSTDTATSITDTNTVATMAVVVSITGTGDSASTIMTIAGVYFESLPFPLPENDFTVFELNGKGTNVTFTHT